MDRNKIDYILIMTFSKNKKYYQISLKSRMTAYLFVFVETGSHYLAQDVLELPMKTRLAINSELSKAGIKGVRHHIQV